MEDIAFRLASVSKLVSAAGILAMREQGLIDLDRDADTGLPYSLRHPQAPDVPITLRMLLTHTAGIFDGERYLKGIERGEPAGGLMAGDSHTKHLPGEGCEYSNFGVGLAGCVAEAQTGLSFECAMQRYLFEPLGMKASYYPQLLDSLVANARRIFPPQKHINFDAAARQARPKTGWDTPDAQAHHLFAHGSCCMDVKSLVTLGQALMTPGFFTQDTLQEMRSPLGSLHGRDPSLTQGLGMFILEDEQLSPNPLYGHQGMAYGAVHMLFLDLARGRGIISLTTGVSEAREYIMADVNRALLKNGHRMTERVTDIKNASATAWSIWPAGDAEGAARPARLHPLKVNEEIELAAYAQKISAEEGRYALEAAVRMLETRDRSVLEIANKLTDAGFSAKSARQACDKLQTLGYLDDARYAQLTAKRLSKKYGAIRIRRELRNKGIQEQLIEDVLEESGTADQVEAAIKIISKSYARQKGEPRPATAAPSGPGPARLHAGCGQAALEAVLRYEPDSSDV